MIKKISILLMGIILVFSACEKDDSIESLYRNAEQMEGDILKSVNTIDRYRTSYEKILLDAPDSDFAAMACYKLAKLNEIFGHYQEAIDYLQKLLVQFPEHRICAEGLFSMAQIYQVHLNKNDDAITAYTQLVHFYPEEIVSLQGMIQLGQLLSAKEQWEDAVYYFHTIIENYPDQPICDDLCFRMGDIVQYKIKDSTRAIEMYWMLMEKYPKSAWVKFAQQRLEMLKLGN